MGELTLNIDAPDGRIEVERCPRAVVAHAFHRVDMVIARIIPLADPPLRIQHC